MPCLRRQVNETGMFKKRYFEIEFIDKNSDIFPSTKIGFKRTNLYML